MDTKVNAVPFQPTGNFEIGPWAQLLLAMAVVGAIVGAAAAFVSQWLYLIILFPFVMGVAVGFIGVKVIEVLKFRNGPAAGVAGLLAALVCVGVMHYGEFYMFQRAIAKVMTEQSDLQKIVDMDEKERTEGMATLKDEDRQALEHFLVIYAGTKSFGSYMDYAASEGVNIQDTHHLNDKGLNLGKTGTWIYWLIEAAIICFFAVSMVWARAREPFCKASNAWKKVYNFTLRGDADATKSAVLGGDLPAIKDVFARKDGDFTHGLKMYLSPRFDTSSAVDVMVYTLSVDRKGKAKEKQTAFVSLPGDVTPEMQSIMQTYSPLGV